MGDTDILEMLNVLAKAGHMDDRIGPSLDVVLSRQDEQGRWIKEKSFNGRFISHIERNGRAARWVTYRVLSLLKNLPEPKQSL